MANKYKWNDFGKLKDSIQLNEYFDGREYTHGDYCHYTKLHTLNDILLNREVWLSSVTGFNDQKERDEIKNSNLKFALCFSTGVNENLPLWYMYAGINGMGGRLRWSKEGIKRLISDAVYTLKSKDKNFVHELSKDEYVITFKDVLYCSEKSLKYNTMFNHRMEEDEIKQYRSEHNGFCKNIVWYYEKETRLMLELKDMDILEGHNDCVVAMKISDKAFNMLKIDMAPEVDGFGFIDKMKCDAIKDFINNTSSLNLSKYNGTVKMDLIKANKKVIVENIELIYEDMPENRVEEIKQLING